MEKIEARVISADYHLVLKILRYGGMTGNFLPAWLLPIRFPAQFFNLHQQAYHK